MRSLSIQSTILLLASVHLRIQSCHRMVRIWWFCVPVLLATMVMASDLTPEVIYYTTSLILYLAEQEPGNFECWFYEHITSASSSFSVLDPIISSEQLALIPKRILYSVDEVHISRQPSVLVMFCDDYYSARELLMDFLKSEDLEHNVKFIVFSESENFKKILGVFYTVKLYDVIFIRTDRLLFGQYLRYRNQFITKSGFVPFDEVFVDQARDLNGYVVKVSTWGSDVLTKTEILGLGKERLSTWIDDAVRALNGSYQVYGVPGTTGREIIWNVYKFNNVLFDVSIQKSTATLVRNQYSLYVSETNSYSIVVPRSRKLLVIEIFVAPFTVEVWIVLLVVVVCGYIWQNIFENDIILLSLCGMHCRDLDRTSRLEKMIVTSLTVLFFLLTSAYEAKVMSLMTSSPHLPDPCTLDDMIRNNITIQHQAINQTFLKNSEDPKLLQIFRYNPNLASVSPQANPNDLHQAYFGGEFNSKLMVNQPANLEPSSGRRKLKIMDGFRGFSVAYYPIALRNPMKRQLVRIERALFEAGIRQLLEHQLIQSEFGSFHVQLLDENQNVTNDVGISELLLGWYVLAFGLGTSSLVFVLECIIARYGRIQRKKRLAWK